MSSSEHSVSSQKSKSVQSSDPLKEPIITDQNETVVQDLVFTLLFNDQGQAFAEKVSNKKLELSQMRALIEEMLAKGFYDPGFDYFSSSSQECQQKPEEKSLKDNKSNEEEDNESSKNPSKPDQQMAEDKEDENEENAVKNSNKNDEEDALEMQEDLKLTPAISIDHETGNLRIDEQRF